MKTDKDTWIESKSNWCETPEELKLFFTEIEEVCKKYNYSISHEDIGGGFIVKKYNIDDMEWLEAASLNDIN